jgi:putative DNA primase/helicase
LTTDDRDPFSRVKAAAEAPSEAHAVRPKADGSPAMPVPADAPPPPDRHPSKGEWSARWTYRDSAGRLLGYVVRIDAPDGKQVLPLTCWTEAGRLKWRWKGFATPRPLYGLDRLALKPDAPVLLVEGEKTADAAADHFPDFAVVTWPGGSKAVAMVDWSALAGREVVIFPDADAPGRKAGDDVARLVSAAGSESIAVVQVPAYLPEGWDLADAWPVGFGPTEAAAAIEEARFEGLAGGVELPYGYVLDAEGLWFEVPGKKGEKIKVRVSSAFEPMGEARDPDGGSWGIVIRFRDPDGRIKTEVVSRAALVSEGAGVKARLAGEGLMIVPGRGQYDRFTSCLAELRCTRRITLVNATGWAPGDRFVLPSRVIGPPGAEQVLFTGDAGALHYRAAGTLQGWRDGVAAKASGNPLLLLALSIGFAGPLLRPLGLEGGGFHLRGGSSNGKTTLGLAAGSIWGGGGPLGSAHSWRATANALEMIAYGHSETLLVLDELALVAPEEAGQAAYALATGQGKARSKTDGQLRKRSEWRAMMLSTGEIGLADHIRSSRRGDRAMAGQELRLLDIAADAGKGMGVWEELHSAGGPAEMSDALKAATRDHYGHAGPAFLEQFVHDIEDAKKIGGEVMAAFMAKAKRPDDHGQVHRAALRFALVAAAGELASAFGVTSWAAGEPAEAILGLFNRWADAFGRDAPREERDVLRTLKGAIEQDLSRFANLGEDRGAEWEEPASDRAGEARSLKTLGFRHVAGPDTYYLFHDAGWAEVFRGFDLRFAAQTLLEAGYLEKGDGKHMKKQKKVQSQNRRFYWVKAAILELDTD